jgi:hypothetical protein
VKSRILDEFCATCGYHRKHAIRVLKKFKRFTKPKPKKRGRRAVYRTEDIIRPLKRIWLAANLPCSKRLKAIIPLWLPGYADTFGAVLPGNDQGLKENILLDDRQNLTTCPCTLYKTQKVNNQSGNTPEETHTDQGDFSLLKWEMVSIFTNFDNEADYKNLPNNILVVLSGP